MFLVFFHNSKIIYHVHNYVQKKRQFEYMKILHHPSHFFLRFESTDFLLIVFFLGGLHLGLHWSPQWESPMGVPNGVPSGVPKIFWVESPKNGVPNRISYQNFQLESPKRKVESPMFFKKFSWESPVCFVKMVLDIIFRFPWTHLSSPYHIRHLSEVESDIWKKTFSYTKMVFQNDIYTSP